MNILIIFAICTKLVLSASLPKSNLLSNQFEVMAQKCSSLSDAYNKYFPDDCKTFNYNNITLIKVLNAANSREVMCRVFLSNFEAACNAYPEYTGKPPLLDQISPETACTDLAFIGNTTENTYIKHNLFMNLGKLCLKSCLSFTLTETIEPVCAAAYALNQLVVEKRKSGVDVVKGDDKKVPPITEKLKITETSRTSAVSAQAVVETVDSKGAASAGEVNKQETTAGEAVKTSIIKQPPKPKPETRPETRIDTENNPEIPQQEHPQQQPPQQSEVQPPQKQPVEVDPNANAPPLVASNDRQEYNPDDAKDDGPVDAKEVAPPVVQEKPLDLIDVHNEAVEKPAVDTSNVGEPQEANQADSRPDMVELANANDENDDKEAVPKDSDAAEKPHNTDDVNDTYASHVDGDSYFFSYFMMLCIVVVLVYVGYHNKQKIRAIVIEGPRGRRQQRRRPNSASYHKLDTNLEEAISSSCTKNSSHIIY